MIPQPDGAARPFQDILDGYFTLRESLRQMAERQGFTGITLTLIQAPVMDVRGLAEDEPVPLHLREGHAGLIDTLILTALRADDGGMLLSGAGDWRWFDDRADTSLPADVRLGEPAFARGFGWSAAAPGAGSATEALADMTAALVQRDRFRAFFAQDATKSGQPQRTTAAPTSAEPMR